MEFETVLEQTIALVQRQGKRYEAVNCSLRSTTGSPRALTPPICKRRRPCWRSWLDMQSAAVGNGEPGVTSVA